MGAVPGEPGFKVKRKCALRGKYGGCMGPVEHHHVIKRQSIKSWLSWLCYMPPWLRAKKGLPDPVDLPSRTRAIADDRGQMDLCNQHHQLVENRRIPLGAMPVQVREFTAELGMEWYWEGMAMKESQTCGGSGVLAAGPDGQGWS